MRRAISAHGQNEKEKRFRNKGLRHLWPPVCMAQEMGKGLGRGAILF
jgi:hypothetical protein